MQQAIKQPQAQQAQQPVDYEKLAKEQKQKKFQAWFKAQLKFYIGLSLIVIIGSVCSMIFPINAVMYVMAVVLIIFFYNMGLWEEDN